MKEACLEDLIELKNYYEFISGGLMLNALDLEPDMDYPSELSTEYEKLGFKRERHLFSLGCDGHTKGFPYGCCVRCRVEHVKPDQLYSRYYHGPCQIFPGISSLHLWHSYLFITKTRRHLFSFTPPRYLEHQQITPEKIYNLWAFDCRYTESFLEYLKNLASSSDRGRRTRKLWINWLIPRSSSV